MLYDYISPAYFKKNPEVDALFAKHMSKLIDQIMESASDEFKAAIAAGCRMKLEWKDVDGKQVLTMTTENPVAVDLDRGIVYERGKWPND